MDGLKKFITGLILTMIAIFIIESVYNWKESKAAFIEAYHNERNSE